MLDILLQHQQYVPSYRCPKVHHIASTNEDIIVDTIKYIRLLFGGDQLTSCRIRGVQRTMKTSDSQELRCNGLFATTEDWHTKIILLKVILIMQWHAHIISMYIGYLEASF